ncbi:MAG: type II toxin-antitoxin system Phd/YefM family antitoxin [Spirochaetaceae bacterium]|nr:type II toxin-antitoxin system Phd/YefM family antitoxin [Spirochaetaceae bacterium]
MRKSTDLRNNYGKISDFCHKYREPVFITKNGEGDLAVMSIETYEELAGSNELYRLIQEGIDETNNTVFLYRFMYCRRDWINILTNEMRKE